MRPFPATEVSLTIGEKVLQKWNFFIKKQYLEKEAGLENEILDMVKRDVAWACVEDCLNKTGFFTSLLQIYQEGYFPCAWEGIYPDGRAVVM